MIFRFLQLIFLLALGPIQGFTSPAFATTSSHTLLILGDSLSAAHNIPVDSSWPSLLQQRLDEGTENIQAGKWRVVNASISGETTNGGLARLPELLNIHQPDLCLIELGGNDGLRGQNLNLISSNLSALIQQCQQQAKVILFEMRITPNYGKRYTEAFTNIYHQLAKKHHVTLMPFLLTGTAGTDAMQEDGIHPKASAQGKILDNIWQVLLDHL